MNGDRPWISLCNFVQEWSTLSNRQRKGFRKLYAAGCGCKVRENWGDWARHYGRLGQLWSQRSNFCEWSNYWYENDCQALHSMCVPTIVMGSLKNSETDAQQDGGWSSKAILRGRRRHDLHRLPDSNDVQAMQCAWAPSRAYQHCLKESAATRADEISVDRDT